MRGIDVLGIRAKPAGGGSFIPPLLKTDFADRRYSVMMMIDSEHKMSD